MLHDDLLYDGQTQACSVRFRGEKWPEELWNRARSHTRPIVENRDPLNSAVVVGHDFPAEKDSAAVDCFGASLSGVSGEIEQRLPQQAFVSRNASQGAFVPDTDLRHGLGYFRHDALHDS